MRPQNPAELPQRLIFTDSDSAIDETPGKITEPEDKELVYQKEIKYLDIDFLQHVNNVKYVEYVLDCFTLDDYRAGRIKALQVNFLAEAKFGDTLSLSKKALSGNTFYVDGESQTGKKIFQALVEWEK